MPERLPPFDQVFSTEAALTDTELQAALSGMDTRTLLGQFTKLLVAELKSFASLDEKAQVRVVAITTALIATLENRRDDTAYKDKIPQYIRIFESELEKLKKTTASQEPPRVEAAAAEPERIPEVICAHCGFLWKGWMFVCANDGNMLGDQKSFWNRNLDSPEAKTELANLIAEFPQADLPRRYEILSLVHSFKVYLPNDPKNSETKIRLENKIVEMRKSIEEKPTAPKRSMPTSPSETTPMGRQGVVGGREQGQLTVCTDCGAPVPNELRFCPKCGNDIHQEVEGSETKESAPQPAQKSRASRLTAWWNNRTSLRQLVTPEGKAGDELKAKIEPIIAQIQATQQRQNQTLEEPRGNFSPPVEQAAAPETLQKPKFAVEISGTSNKGDYEGHNENEDTYWTSAGSHNFDQVAGVNSLQAPQPTKLERFACVAFADGVSSTKSSRGSKLVIKTAIEHAYENMQASKKQLTESEWKDAFVEANEAIWQDTEFLCCINEKCPQTKKTGSNRRKASARDVLHADTNPQCAHCSKDLRPQASNLLAVSLDLNTGELSYSAVSDPVGVIVKSDESVVQLHDERHGYLYQLGSGRQLNREDIHTQTIQAEAGDTVLVMSDGVHNSLVFTELEALPSGPDKKIISDFLLPTGSKTHITERYKLLADGEKNIVDDFYAKVHQKLSQTISNEVSRGTTLQVAIEKVISRLRASKLTSKPDYQDDFTDDMTIVVMKVKAFEAQETKATQLPSLTEVLAALRRLNPKDKILVLRKSMLMSSPSEQQASIVLRDLELQKERVARGDTNQFSDGSLILEIILNGQKINIQEMLTETLPVRSQRGSTTRPASTSRWN